MSSCTLIGDKGYIRPALTQDRAEQGIHLITPLRRNMQDRRPKRFIRQMMRIRRQIETTIHQLSEYFSIEQCNCRDIWHLTSRMSRKILALTVGAYFNIQAGKEPMQFEGLVSA